MEQDLIPIGKMASINHVSIATLRLYDQMGLLKPRYVDSVTNYRYYGIEQNSRLDLIAYMKELDMSLSEIKAVLDSKDLALIEAILIKKNEQIYHQIRDLKLRQDAVERSIRSIEEFRKSPTPGIPNLQFIDRRYVFKKKCTSNFYDGNLSDYEKTLLEFRNELIANGFSYIHTYNVGTSVEAKDFLSLNLKAKDIFIFVESQLNKERKDIEIVESGMYACIYGEGYDSEKSCAEELLSFCSRMGWKIIGDYICEVLTEVNLFDEKQRSMYLRLQVPVAFK